MQQHRRPVHSEDLTRAGGAGELDRTGREEFAVRQRPGRAVTELDARDRAVRVGRHRCRERHAVLQRDVVVGDHSDPHQVVDIRQEVLQLGADQTTSRQAVVVEAANAGIAVRYALRL